MVSPFRCLSAGKLFLLGFLYWNIPESIGFVHNSLPSIARKKALELTSSIPKSTKTRCVELSATNDSDTKDVDEDGGEDEVEEVTTVRYKDDGMTDRFKYKVHALMGDYDPSEGMVDNEDQDGKILKALVTFPPQLVFDVVGKINDGDDDCSDSSTYADKVRSIVFDTTGDEDIKCDIIPRGTKFVKVRCEATVESTTMINNIYDELGAMASTVMKF